MAWRIVVLALMLLNEASSAPNTQSSKRLDKPNTYPEKLHCFCSRYVLHYFRLNAIVFKNKVGVDIADKNDSYAGIRSSFDGMDYYDQLLRSQGHIVMAMLDELRKAKSDCKPPDDLMRVNLYINNTRDNLRVRVDQSAASFHQHKLIKGYKHFYKTMTEALSKFINDGKCLSTHKITDQDDENERNKLEAIKKLINKSLPELYELNKALSILEANRQQLETIFEATLGDEMYLDFKPDRLLFLSLVDLDSEYLRMVSVDKGQTKNNSAGDEKIILDDSLMVSKVRTSYQFGDRSFASITDLLILVRPIFHQDYVISFQQHVMAAALQPVSMCLGEYLSALKRLVDADTTKQDRSVIIMYDSHTDKLRTGAQDLCKHLNSLINLEMFPESVQEYLKYMSNETSEVIEFINGYSIISDDTRSEFTSGVINLIIEKISQSMRLSHMKFMINVKSFSFVDRDDVAKVLIGLNDKIKKIGAYVANLERYKYMFLRGLKIYDHKNMFVTQNVDIQNTKHLGYKVVKNDLDNPPIIQLI